ncbi:MAG TPA: hypothetical protein VEA69_06290 [Tepidisphaeraceae bacterium]|nr:hypothetical protein [Tepidisphaeraceae bacterium]
MPPLEKELETVLLKRYEQWKVVYNATRFKGMMNPTSKTYKGPVGTVRHLLAKRPSVVSGFHRLTSAGQLELTIEALFKDDQPWHALFTPMEIAKARQRYHAAKTK